MSLSRYARPPADPPDELFGEDAADGCFTGSSAEHGGWLILAPGRSTAPGEPWWRHATLVPIPPRADNERQADRRRTR